MKLGIFGGTFDPVHNGHLRAARLAARALELERVLMIPTNVPPHKEARRGAAPLQRMEMLRLAVRDDPVLQADGRELRREGKSYSVDTVSQVAAEYPGAELWFICGTDMFLTVHTWYRAEELLKMTGIAVVPREDGAEEPLFEQKNMLEKTYGARVFVVKTDALEISSTALRESGMFGGSLPEAVEKYIKMNGLYT